jgi:hypothetical protein
LKSLPPHSAKGSHHRDEVLIDNDRLLIGAERINFETEQVEGRGVESTDTTGRFVAALSTLNQSPTIMNA